MRKLEKHRKEKTFDDFANMAKRELLCHRYECVANEGDAGIITGILKECVANDGDAGIITGIL